MGGYSTYFTPSIYPAFAMLFPRNMFTMEDLHLSSHISYRGSQFYIMRYALHKIPSFGSNLYPHLSNPCHDIFSSQTYSLVMMPLQPSMNQFGGGHYPTWKGQGVYKNPP
jgi:hypothetical protein